ncbi:MAG: hypothetical protein KAJ15_13960, partial [Spirochaetes bacterium]|nr:hypothetical protein [Spirochaetota bacterium]
MPDKDTILKVKDLKVYFSEKERYTAGKKNVIRAVDGVTFSIKRGKCWEKMDICFSEEPELKEVKKGHFTACFLY